MYESKKRKINLDQLLTEQTTPGLIGTIEAIDGNAKLVKITPWQPNSGCMCHASFKISKDNIKSVTPTGDFHYCCGKRLHVLEIEFYNDKSVPISEFIAHFINQSENKNHSSQEHFAHSTRSSVAVPKIYSIDCVPGQARCGDQCYDPDLHCCCRDSHGHFFVRPLLAGYTCRDMCKGGIY